MKRDYDTLIPFKTGEIIVEAVEIQLTDVFRHDYSFLRRSAYLQSNFGQNVSKLESGGIWKISKSIFNGTINNQILQWAYEKIQDKFGFEWNNKTYSEIVLLTDGRSDNSTETISEANRAKKFGIHILGVGIGAVDETELNNIDPGYISADSFYAAHSITTKVRDTACAVPENVTPEGLNSTLQINFVQFYKYEIPLDGLTIVPTVVSGKVNIYYSFYYQTPSSALNEGSVQGPTYIFFQENSKEAYF